MERFLKRAWAEIYLDRLEHNLNAARSCIDLSKTQPVCVVKANAYGHDDEHIVPFLEELGVRFFAVSNIKEAEKLRKYGVSSEILILGHTPCEYACRLAELNIIQTAVSEEYAVKLSTAAVKENVMVKIHVAADTGMGRIGICAYDEKSCEEAAEAVLRISRLEGVVTDGIFTHFACADSYDKSDIAYTKNQKDCFFGLCDMIREKGVILRHTHCLNSAGSIFHYDDRSTLARLGITIYGLKPDSSLNMPFETQPVMELKAAVSHVKKMDGGHFISYGRTYCTEGERVIATVPIGYADGYSRCLSGKAYVLINGKKAPIAGRICMDQLMADVTGIEDVHEGSIVTLIGRDGDEVITADDLAGLYGTIGYEVICGISKRIPRVIYRNGEIADVVEYY
ncbi:MAG: alanine racemase [Huintestinicola sp.]